MYLAYYSYPWFGVTSSKFKAVGNVPSGYYERNIDDTLNIVPRLTFKYEAQTALFKDPVRTAQ